MKTDDVSQRVLMLERERRVLLRSLLHPGPMVSGGLVERWIVCGKAGCRCQTGERHGPYYYRSVPTARGPRLEYVGKRGQSAVPLLKRYQGYQRRMARLNTVQREIVQLLWQLAERKVKPLDKAGGGQ